MNILVTGCAGFIGFHLVSKLLQNNKFEIFGLDNLNTYYDLKLKKDRLKILKKNKKFFFTKGDITSKKFMNNYFKRNKFNIVIHLAAQAGVRYSTKNPSNYFYNNIEGFFNILDLCKNYKIKHLLFASTSSVYGASKKFPLNEAEITDKPLSFYAASKKTNEVMAYSYSNIFKLPCTALRFSTVYGPYGRPDMSLYKFTKNIVNSKSIELYNRGNHVRDFTYIDDVVNFIYNLIKVIPRGQIPYSVYNLGSNDPKKLFTFLEIIEKNLNRKAKKKLLPLQLGDVHKTHADNKQAIKATNHKIKINIETGIKKFIEWYKLYYK